MEVCLGSWMLLVRVTVVEAAGALLQLSGHRLWRLCQHSRTQSRANALLSRIRAEGFKAEDGCSELCFFWLSCATYIKWLP